MRWQVLPNGDLEIRVDAEEQAELREARDDEEFSSNRIMYAVLEPLITDDEYDWVLPEWIGALTEAPILGTFGDEAELPLTVDPDFHRTVGAWNNKSGKRRIWYTPVLNAWWFEPYALRSPQEDLAEVGRCVFTRALQTD